MVARGDKGGKMGLMDRQCPYCKESVRRDASRCKHCHADLVPESSGQIAQESKQTLAGCGRLIATVVGVLIAVYLAIFPFFSGMFGRGSSGSFVATAAATVLAVLVCLAIGSSAT